MTLEQQIAEVLREHEFYSMTPGPDGHGTEDGCTCGTALSLYEGMGWLRYRAHVAAVIVERLGLVEEWGVRLDDASRVTEVPEGEDVARAAAETLKILSPGSIAHVLKRHHTPWADVEEGE